MSVIVYVREADSVFPAAKHPQLACCSCFDEVWHEERVAGTVYLVGRHSHGQELVAAGVSEELLTDGLRLCVLLKISLLRQLRQLVLREPVDVAAIEACARRRGHHDLRDACSQARLDDMPRPFDIDVLVELARMKGPHGCAYMPHAVGTLDCSCHVSLTSQVSLKINYPWILPGGWVHWEDVKGDHSLCSSLNQHFYQALPNEAASTCDHTIGGHWRVIFLCSLSLKRGQRWCIAPWAAHGWELQWRGTKFEWGSCESCR
mmetsp:Transcript_88908/g.160313  ORF Transcript_88908/g.160313 Transcript_88908/m.160313 type:complete len:261 (+) Transcript_88908:496-1278(+)